MRKLSEHTPDERLPIYLAIWLFIQQQIERHPRLASSPLASWRPGHETQIMVDGSHPIRIPYKGNTAHPAYNNRNIQAGVTNRWTLIGTSGWDWKNKLSHWVGFDFDSADGHTNGLAATQLQDTAQAIKTLPYVTLRTSKGGKGYHALVPFEKPVNCPMRSDQNRIAKHVLDRMSTDADFDFSKTVDVGGKILWHWSDNLPPNGLLTLQTAV